MNMNSLENPSLAASLLARRMRTPDVAVLLLLVVGLALTGCSRMSEDAAALRESVMTATGAEWEREVEIGVGALPLTLARAALSFLDLDSEARSALETVRDAHVGVYQGGGARHSASSSAVLTAADEAMSKRGWDRLVTVMDGDELVVVFVPEDLHSPRHVKVCVLVLDGAELVVVAARSNLEPLLELAFDRSARSWRKHVLSSL
jgi:hypothetical protein